LNAQETKLSTNPVLSSYRAPGWLIGQHSQTIWPSLIAPKPVVQYKRLSWDTPDGDFIDLDVVQGTNPSVPTLVLFHGLEGSSQSAYSRALMAKAKSRGWHGMVAHFRGCGGTINRLKRAYHSGDSDHVDFVLRQVRKLNSETALFAVGISLGGNALLKWLGSEGHQAQFVQAAFAISPPHDLEAGAVVLSQGFNRNYTNNFLTTLKRKTVQKEAMFPGQIDLKAALNAKDFFYFDEVVTAPLHGFRGCYDYWRKSSCKQFLGGITVPTTILNALNDPFQPIYALANHKEISAQVKLQYTAQGGHVGFLQGGPPGNQFWLCDQVFNFFTAQL
jgi:uncharacterized protein